MHEKPSDRDLCENSYIGFLESIGSLCFTPSTHILQLHPVPSLLNLRPNTTKKNAVEIRYHSSRMIRFTERTQDI